MTRRSKNIRSRRTNVPREPVLIYVLEPAFSNLIFELSETKFLDSACGFDSLDFPARRSVLSIH